MTAMLQPNGLDAQAIFPDLSAKYSPNLYKWLIHRSQAHLASIVRVYRDESGVLWIGRLDANFLSGARLMSVLCFGTRTKSAAYPVSCFKTLTEVSDFWARYTQDGRCAIDPEHNILFAGDDTRWSIAGDVRRCLWCSNTTQVLRRWTQSDTAQRETWESVK